MLRRDLVESFKTHQKEERERFARNISLKTALLDYTRKFDDVRYYCFGDFLVIEIPVPGEFVKNTYIMFDELCDRLNLDPENFIEYFDYHSIDFTYKATRIEYTMTGTCKPVYKKKTVETSEILGYDCF